MMSQVRESSWIIPKRALFFIRDVVCIQYAVYPGDCHQKLRDGWNWWNGITSSVVKYLLHILLSGQTCLVSGLEHVFFPYIGNNNPNWLSYFSEGLKPPTSIYRCQDQSKRKIHFFNGKQHKNLCLGNEGMIHWLTINKIIPFPQQPIHSLRKTHQ